MRIPRHDQDYSTCYYVLYTHKNHRWYLHTVLRFVTGEYKPVIFSCMALTKLSLIFTFNWISEQIKQFNTYHQY